MKYRESSFIFSVLLSLVSQTNQSNPISQAKFQNYFFFFGTRAAVMGLCLLYLQIQGFTFCWNCLLMYFRLLEGSDWSSYLPTISPGYDPCTGKPSNIHGE